MEMPPRVIHAIAIAIGLASAEQLMGEWLKPRAGSGRQQWSRAGIEPGAGMAGGAASLVGLLVVDVVGVELVHHEQAVRLPGNVNVLPQVIPPRLNWGNHIWCLRSHPPKRGGVRLEATEIFGLQI